jgi:hypothetical protein
MSPQSNLDQITHTVPPTQISTAAPVAYNPMEFCAMLEQTLPNNLFKYYTTGLNYYKPSTSDAAFIKNLISLFSLYMTTSLKESDVNIEQQSNIQRCLDLVTTNMEHNLKFLDHSVSELSTKKNVFDARKLALIIIGYAITYIKKTN